VLIPGVGYLLTFRDTENNVFAILEPVRRTTLRRRG
jgi:predicted enzyme related to lactoylglutathione lyase